MEQVLRHWQRRHHEGAEEGAAGRPAPRPFTITLSREAGARGAQVARVLGERLGWPVYDQELLRLIGEEMGVRTKLIESVDEKQRHWLQECLETFGSSSDISSSGYVRHLVEMLLSLAAHGRCIIVGRGAAQVLPAATTLRVRLVAPRDDRIAVIRQRRGLTEKEAAAWVDRTDRERVHFVKEHFRQDPSDPRQYDLVLNSGRFSVEECAELITAALERMTTRKAARPAAAGA
jgi:cytidylate kinase